MRALLILTGLLLLAPAAAADARAICGPSKAKTLARGAEARLYRTGSTISGCSRGKRPITLGRATTYRLAGHYAAVVRRRRVTVYDLRAREATLRAKRAGRVRQLTLLPDGRAIWLAGDGDKRAVVRDGDRLWRDRNLRSVGLAGGVLLIGYRSHSYWALADDPAPAGILARIGRVRLSARDGVIYTRYRGRRTVRLGGAYENESSSGGGGVSRVIVDGRTVAARTNRYAIASLAGGSVRVFDTTSRKAKTLCAAERAVGDVVIHHGHVACVAEDDAVTRIDVDGMTLERFSRSDTTLSLRGGRLVWRHDGETHFGPAPGATVCGPASAKTLGQSPQARVYDRSGTAAGCVAGRAVALGRAQDVLDVTMAGAFAAVHRSGESLTVYDLRSGQVVGKPVSAPRMTKVALGDTGVAAYLAPNGVGDTVTGAYPGATGGSTLRVLGPLVVWARPVRIDLHRALDAPIPDGLAWAALNSFSLRVVDGQLIYGRRIALGPAESIAVVDHGGPLIGVLTTTGDLTVRPPYADGGVTRPCPAPVHDFILDYDGDATCT